MHLNKFIPKTPLIKNVEKNIVTSSTQMKVQLSIYSVLQQLLVVSLKALI